MGGDGEKGKKGSESPNYSYFPLPAKITDGASHTQTFIAGSVLQEAERISRLLLLCWENDYTLFPCFQALIFFLWQAAHCHTHILMPPPNAEPISTLHQG